MAYRIIPGPDSSFICSDEHWEEARRTNVVIPLPARRWEEPQRYRTEASWLQLPRDATFMVQPIPRLLERTHTITTLTGDPFVITDEEWVAALRGTETDTSWGHISPTVNREGRVLSTWVLQENPHLLGRASLMVFHEGTTLNFAETYHSPLDQSDFITITRVSPVGPEFRITMAEWRAAFSGQETSTSHGRVARALGNTFVVMEEWWLFQATSLSGRQTTLSIPVNTRFYANRGSEHPTPPSGQLLTPADPEARLPHPIGSRENPYPLTCVRRPPDAVWVGRTGNDNVFRLESQFSSLKPGQYIRERSPNSPPDPISFRKRLLDMVNLGYFDTLSCPADRTLEIEVRVKANGIALEASLVIESPKDGTFHETYRRTSSGTSRYDLIGTDHIEWSEESDVCRCGPAASVCHSGMCSKCDKTAL